MTADFNAKFSLESPTKKIVDDERRSSSPETVGDVNEELEALRKQYVGEVELPESTLSC